MSAVWITSAGASVVSGWIPLPAFATSQMVENSWPMQNILAEFFYFPLVMVLWFVGGPLVVVACCVKDLSNSLLLVFQIWRRWLITANILIELKLMKPSQTSWKMFVHHFLVKEFYNREWTQWTELPYPLLTRLQKCVVQLFQRLIGQDELVNAEINKPATISKNGKNNKEWREFDKMMEVNLNLHLLPPLANIVQEYETASTKINLLTVDLEHYFKSNGRVELQLFFDHTQHLFGVRIFDRGNPLLVQVPTSFLIDTCVTKGHPLDCDCGPNLSISNPTVSTSTVEGNALNDRINSELAKLGELQLAKNLIFIKYLWEKLLPNLFPEFKLGLNFTEVSATVKVVEMPWKKSMVQEFKTATFSVSDLVFCPELYGVGYSSLQFVGVE